MAPDLRSLPQRSLYVYYRVPAGGHAQAHAAVSAMQANLRASHPGLVARLMCRADGRPDADGATWMEVYEHPEGVSAACEAQLLALSRQWDGRLTGPRHVESFCPLADSASAQDRNRS